MLNPNIAAIRPVTIPVGSPLTLRYRVVVHDGDTPTRAHSETGGGMARRELIRAGPHVLNLDVRNDRPQPLRQPLHP